MYKSKNYAYKDKVKYDEEGVIFIPTVNLSDRAGGVKLTKGSGLVLHSMLVPMSEVGHKETLKQYSKEIRDKPEDKFTARTMKLFLSLRLLLKLEVFQVPTSGSTGTYTKLITFDTLVKGLMSNTANRYMKDRYYLKADEKT